MFQQLPTAGLPFQFELDGFELRAGPLTTGVIDEINEIRWDVRPVARLGTIETGSATGSPPSPR